MSKRNTHNQYQDDGDESSSSSSSDNDQDDTIKKQNKSNTIDDTKYNPTKQYNIKSRKSKWVKYIIIFIIVALLLFDAIPFVNTTSIDDQELHGHIYTDPQQLQQQKQQYKDYQQELKQLNQQTELHKEQVVRIDQLSQLIDQLGKQLNYKDEHTRPDNQILLQLRQQETIDQIFDILIDNNPNKTIYNLIDINEPILNILVEKTKGKHYQFLLFLYRYECPFSLKAYPIYRELARQFQYIPFFRINGHIQGNARTTPTLLLYTEGEPLKYKGEKEFNTMQKWIIEHTRLQANTSIEPSFDVDPELVEKFNSSVEKEKHSGVRTFMLYLSIFYLSILLIRSLMKTIPKLKLKVD